MVALLVEYFKLIILFLLIGSLTALRQLGDSEATPHRAVARRQRTRRMVIDFLHFAAAVPTIPVQRRMALHELAGARAACRDRVRWTVLFTKAYALVAREFPELRRAYVTIPWPVFYEYPVSYANVVVERT